MGVMRGALVDMGYQDDSDGVKKNLTKKVYSEKFAKELLARNIDLDTVLPLVINYAKRNNEISPLKEEGYRNLYKDKGEEWVEKMEQAINFTKNKEHQYKILKDLKNVFGSGGYRVSKSAKEWYDNYFKEYIAGLDVSDYDKHDRDIDVAMVLIRLDKFDELDKIKKWNLLERGFSFDDNLLNSLAKIICKSSVNYHRHYKDAIIDRDKKDEPIDGDVKARKLYDWVIDHVDESEYKIKVQLIACYHKFERTKYDAFVDEVMKMRDNYKTRKYKRTGYEYVEVSSTLRIAPLRYALMYFATKDLADEYEKLVRRLFEYRKEGTPRTLKMNNPEFNKTIEVLDRIKPDSYTTERTYQNEFVKFNKELISEIKSGTSKVKESRIFRWNEFFSYK
jgi:hypothetical protein